MESYEHFIISAVVSLPLIYMVAGFPGIVLFTAYWLYSIAAGTLIDLDHFIISTIRDRNFKEVSLALSNPKKILTDNNEALDNTIPEWSRYISHVVILIGFPLLLLNYSTVLAELTFAVLLVHLISDIYGSYREYYLE